jgi:glycosyltransferase involved in cell wall biosynthesis
MKLSSLSILIPCYNCAATIENVVRNAYHIAKQTANRYEIILCNDASTDNTTRILSKLKHTIPVLTVITHKKNQGYGKTIKELYFAGRCDWLFSLPGDGQFDAQELTKLIPAAKSRDLILGWRRERHDSFRRLIESRVYHALLFLRYRLIIHDVNTIRLMKRSLLAGTTLTSDSAFVDAQLVIQARDKGFSIAEIPVIHKPRLTRGATGGSLTRTILPTIRDLLSLTLP